MTDEQWRPVVSYEGSYEVSDHGRVRSVDRRLTYRDGRQRLAVGQPIRTWCSSKGYIRVRLHRDGAKQSYNMHQLVLAAFVGPCPPGMEGCHNNGDKSDYTVGNLRWDTRSENAFDRVRHGVHQHAKKTHCPRGHLLSDPNLVPSAKKFGRMCKACNRARANVQYAKQRGESHDFTAWADDHYVRIMGR